MKQTQKLHPEEEEVTIKKEQKVLKDQAREQEQYERAIKRQENFWKC